MFSRKTIRRLTDGSWIMAGTLFLDYQCKADFSDSPSIVYGHNMKNDSMFGILPNYAEQSYFDEHPTMYLLTPVHILPCFKQTSLKDADKLLAPPRKK